MERIILEQTTDMDVEDIEELILEGWKGTSMSAQDKILLEKYSNLDYLSLSKCGLKTLANFPVLTNLIKLDLNDNEIKGNLEALSGLHELMQLNLANNGLTQIENFQPLAHLQNLVYLDIEKNPVASIENYREKIFKIIPNLQVVDGIDKTGKEISLDSDDSQLPDGFDDDDEDEFSDEDDESDENESDSESEELPKKRSNGPSVVAPPKKQGNGPSDKNPTGKRK